MRGRGGRSGSAGGSGRGGGVGSDGQGRKPQGENPTVGDEAAAAAPGDPGGEGTRGDEEWEKGGG